MLKCFWLYKKWVFLPTRATPAHLNSVWLNVTNVKRICPGGWTQCVCSDIQSSSCQCFTGFTHDLWSLTHPPQHCRLWSTSPGSFSFCCESAGTGNVWMSHTNVNPQHSFRRREDAVRCDGIYFSQSELWFIILVWLIWVFTQQKSIYCFPVQISKQYINSWLCVESDTKSKNWHSKSKLKPMVRHNYEVKKLKLWPQVII